VSEMCPSSSILRNCHVIPREEPNFSPPFPVPPPPLNYITWDNETYNSRRVEPFIKTKEFASRGNGLKGGTDPWVVTCTFNAMIKQSWTLDWTEGSYCSEENFAVQQKRVFNTAPFISSSALSLLSVLKSVHSQEDATVL
jgi:hypothetical protein